MKLTNKAAQALTNLRASHDFGQFLEWIAECEAKDTQTCVDAEGAQLLRAQGSVKALQGIAKAYVEAPTLTEKLKSQRGRQT